MKRGFWFFLALLLVSALIGSAIGEIAGILVGPDSPVYHFFTVTASPSFGPVELDLILTKVTFGIAVHLNLLALLAMIVATIYYLRTS